MTTSILATVVLIVLCAGPAAYAEWVEIVKDDNQTFYIDPGTIQHTESRAKVWELVDHMSSQPFQRSYYFSARIHVEYDCIEETRRILAITYLSGNMGSGAEVFKGSGEGPWVPIPPGTIGQSLRHTACNKK